MCHDIKVLKTPPATRQRRTSPIFSRSFPLWKVEGGGWAGVARSGKPSHRYLLNVESFINDRSQTIKEVLLWSVMVDKHVGFILCATSKPVFLIVEDYTASSKQVKGVKCLFHEETFYTNTYTVLTRKVYDKRNWFS
jgi:hypothetical protein